MGQVSEPCATVVPITPYETLGQMHYHLRAYKDSPSSSVRERSSLYVAALLARFLYEHGDCIERIAGGWDFVTSVPSTSGRSGIHPLEAAAQRVPWLAQRRRTVLGPGSVSAKHNHASDSAFAAIAPVQGERILVIDDTYTSGARAQSAASALSLAGAATVAIVPVGRVIAPSFSDDVREFWKTQRAIPFRFDACCLESS